jgi:hypothetical protein
MRTIELEPRRVVADAAPADDNALHEFIVREYGINVPRVACCSEHVAPFVALADLYFGRVSAALWHAARGAGKTTLGALWVALSSRCFPGCSSLMVAASEVQGGRGYDALVGFADPDTDTTLKRRTVFSNASIAEHASGSVASIRGWHGQKLFADEVDEWEWETLQAALKTPRSAGGVPGQVLLASTRSYTRGVMQLLLDECASAAKHGQEPPFSVYEWCSLDVVEEQGGCGVECVCARVVKDGRAFSEVCRGRLRDARGFVDLRDLHRDYRTSDPFSFAGEMLLEHAATKASVLPTFSEDRHAVQGWCPIPELGSVVMAADWGYAHESALLLIQWLREPFQYVDENGKPFEFRTGDVFIFDELYERNRTPTELAALQWQRERNWGNAARGFSVSYRVRDVQDPGAASTFTYGRPRWRWVPYQPKKDLRRETQAVAKLVEADRLFYNAKRVQAFPIEAAGWRWAKDRNVPATGDGIADHTLAALRYAVAFCQWHERRAPGSFPDPTDEVAKLKLLAPQSERPKARLPVAPRGMTLGEYRELLAAWPSRSRFTMSGAGESPWRSDLRGPWRSEVTWQDIREDRQRG